MFRAGARCPVEGCGFAMAIEVETEDEADIIALATTQAHADYAHGGIPVTLYGVPVLPDQSVLERVPVDPEQDGERPAKLVN